jgi:hypothetical protein
MRFTIEGREYDFAQKMTVEEAMVFQDKANLGMSQIDEELNRGNPYAVTALIYLGKKRAGEAVRWQDLMGLDLLTFQRMGDKPADDEVIDAVPERRADPTLPDGTTPAGDTTTTS